MLELDPFISRHFKTNQHVNASNSYTGQIYIPIQNIHENGIQSLPNNLRVKAPFIFVLLVNFVHTIVCHVVRSYYYKYRYTSSSFYSHVRL